MSQSSTTPERIQRGPRQKGTSEAVDVIASTSLWLVCLIATLSLHNLFAPPGIAPLPLVAVTFALVIGVVRRSLGLSLLAGSIVSALGIAAGLAAWATTRGEMERSVLGVRTFLRTGAKDFASMPNLQTPVAPLASFVVAVIFAAWLVGFLADLLHFGLHAPVQALAAPFTCLAVVGLIARHDSVVGHIRLGIAFGMAVLAHLLIIELRERDRDLWFSNVKPARSVTIVWSIVAIALVAGALFTTLPRTATRIASPVINLRTDRETAAPTVVTSPMVSLQRRLVLQSDVVQFRVRSTDTNGQPARRYWRQTVLDTFDGGTWTSSSATYQAAKKTATFKVAAKDARPVASQLFAMDGLESSWLPLAYEPLSLDLSQFPDGTSALYNKENASLVLKSGSTAQLGYSATSAAPLTASAGEAVPSLSEAERVRYLEVPAAMPQSIRTLAQSTVEGVVDPAEQSRRLQNFLRTFTYSTAVPPPTSQEAIEQFLLVDRTGYCEQFSAGFAVMARILGIPARVAVGFTPGKLRDDGFFYITGKNSHAWPEVFLDGYGWVGFEPTPGRGIPLAESLTGVADQDSSEPPVSESSQPTTTLPTPFDPAVPTTIGENGVPFTPIEPPAPVETSTLSRLLPWLLGLFVLFGLAAAAFATPLLLAKQRLNGRRQLAAEEGPNARVTLAWESALADLDRIGLSVRPAESELEIGKRLSQRGSHAAGLGSIAQLIAKVRYSGRDATPADADRAESQAEAVRTSILGSLENLNRWKFLTGYGSIEQSKPQDPGSAVKGTDKNPGKDPEND